MSQTQNPSSEFVAIAISIASPEEVLSWSYGEVVKPETINYRTQKPERGGLFCEKIFGPTKNWECYCGKYKRIRYKGVVCEKCGVEVTRNIVRRERMGHIKLAVPVTHIWYLRSTPSRLGILLDLPVKKIEQVVYFAAYVITEVDEEEKKHTLKELMDEFKNYKKQLQQDYQKEVEKVNKESGADREKKELVEKVESEFAEKLKEFEESHLKIREALKNLVKGKVISELDYRDFSMKFGHVFKAGIGAEAIRKMIADLDLKKFVEERKEELHRTSGQKQKRIIKRLNLAANMLKARVRPEWMVLTVLPVLPPDLRPMVQLDGGRFAASDLNDLYRRVINRNNRLKRLIEIDAPEVICRNEKRMLQEAVDMLLNSDARQGKTTFNVNERRKLRSLSDMLKGKQGRFRQNLLGKRVDYSGRSVIVVGPNLKLHECGLPKEMALRLFKPFVIGELMRKELAYNIKNAEKVIQSNRKEVWDILEKITDNYYVLLNRAPTLHRLGIQAFKPVLIEGKAIQIHPLVCEAFNADFDGDQMAVHLPLSSRAQKEAREIMVSRNNLLKPSHGEPIINPSLDMVLGCYYLTLLREGLKGEGMIFADLDEAMRAYQAKEIELQAKVKVRWGKELIETTLGRMIFNHQVVPQSLQFINQSMNKTELKSLLAECFEKLGIEPTADMSDAIKKVGFDYVTDSGISIGYADMVECPAKEGIINDASEKVGLVANRYWKGYINAEEKHKLSVRVWVQAKSKITEELKKIFPAYNHIWYMLFSKARGSWDNIIQLSGMKGSVMNPSGEIIELPVISSFKEGFSILEYFIASHAGRKGKSDTALKTAEAGYLTRRLVDSVQNVIVKEADCGQQEGLELNKAESEQIGEEFEKRIFGRTLKEPLIDPETGEILVDVGVQINVEILNLIKKKNIVKVTVYSVLDCRIENGVCQKCYGWDLGTNKLVEIGVPVGIITAQSIGEPGTQLTMRTFHKGGIVSEEGDITQGLARVEELFESQTPKTPAVLAEFNGKVSLERKKEAVRLTLISTELEKDEYTLYGSFYPIVKYNEEVKEKQILARSLEDKNLVRAKIRGIVEKVSDKKVIIRHQEHLEKVYTIPTNSILKVKQGDTVQKGDPLTLGHFDPHQLIKLKGIRFLQQYIVREVKSIYASQGQTINDKYIEIIVKQMCSKVRVVDPGDSVFLPGEILNYIKLNRLNAELKKRGKKEVYGERLLMGLTKVALTTESWLSSASFQETIRCLVEASTRRSVDGLEGLKENVIIGRKIPVGQIYRDSLAKQQLELGAATSLVNDLAVKPIEDTV